MAPHFDSPPPKPPTTSTDTNLNTPGRSGAITMIDSEIFQRPQPRPPRSSSRSEQVRVRNRRREYLVRNAAEYFKSNEHEFADPLLYDQLIRQFLTPAEREADGLRKGYARVLEGSLLRGEERLAKLADEEGESSGVAKANSSSIMPPPPTPTPMTNGMSRRQQQQQQQSQCGNSSYTPAYPATAIRDREDVPPPQTKEEGLTQWEDFLRERFIRGEDEDFDYGLVDGEEEFDVLERTEREEAWFDEESPGWVGDGDGDPDGNSEDVDMERDRRVERVLVGETGIQDF